MTKIKEYKTATGEKTYWFSHYTGKYRKPGIPREIVKRGFKSSEEAEFELAKLKLNLKNHSYEVSDRRVVTFEEVYREWDMGYKNKVNDTTYDRTKTQFKKYILPVFGDLNIKKIGLRDCQLAVNEWSAYYVNFKVLKSAVQRVLAHAVKLRYVTDNPMMHIEMPKKRISYAELTEDASAQFYTPSQLKTFFEVLSNHFTLKEVALFRVLAFTGMRKGEMMALFWSDIDFQNKTIHVRKNMVYVNKEYKITPPKTKKSNRFIKVDETTLYILKQWKKEQSKELLLYGINQNQKGQLVFSRFYREKINVALYPGHPDNIIKKVLDLNSELPAISTHGFRHTHASILIEAGTEMKEIQERLGHASINITADVYGHLTEKARENSANKFAEAVNF
ncbi:MAG: site-specific integrase [Alkalibacterium sp.]|nr:site-specific integrase [Alkalibacterium sp.]